jgi:hypothetical protein
MRNEETKGVFMKNIGSLLLALLLAACATAPAGPGLVSLDEALAEAAADVGSHVSETTEIVITELDTMASGVSDFLSGELSTYLTRSGKFKVLERDLEAVNAEHQFQMSGFVDDKSAVGIGHYLGAKVVITGSFKRFAGFSQLRLRAIDVRTSQLLTMYTVRIRPDDTVLASVMQPLDDAPPVAITENALAYLNRGEDLVREGKYDEAIKALDQTLSINENLGEGHFYQDVAKVNKSRFNFTTEASLISLIDGTVLVRYYKNSANITILAGVTSIGEWAFKECTDLTSITIPPSVTSIGDYAFFGCTNLVTVVVSRKTTIGRNAFPIGAQITYRDIVFEMNGTVLVRYWGNEANVTIPKDVTSIGDYAFGKGQLTSVTIPNSVTSIGIHAFSSNQLTSITIPNSVTSIGSFAFSNNQLMSVSIPNSVTYIGMDAFGNNKLMGISIGANVTLGFNAFEYGFADFYNTQGRREGIYIYYFDTAQTPWERGWKRSSLRRTQQGMLKMTDTF